MFDFFVIGAGLSGSTLAWRLINGGYKIKVFDKPKLNISSNIAGGIINPLTGKRTALTWKAHDIFDELHKFYPETENKTGISFFKLMPTYKLFESRFEQNEWLNKSAEKNYNCFFENIPEYLDQSKINNPFGSLLIKETAKLDVKKYLNTLHNFLLNQNSIEFCMVENLKIGNNSVTFNGEKAKAVIYCDGTFATQNHYFSYLPHKPVHGEVLEVEIENFYNDRMINKGIFIIPQYKNKYIVGSTYNWNIKETVTTQNGRDELEKKLFNLIKLPFKIVNHFAGIRPSTNDRRPFLGKHPGYENVFIFGGMGSKGVSLVPYLSKVFINYISGKGKIPSECDISRIK
ncbi:MAG: FAD-binding oxidoreductase [Bacteroidetes bacterium]|nr:FAD-binding oxidoreductase [Bacteroidota bacterium]